MSYSPDSRSVGEYNPDRKNRDIGNDGDYTILFIPVRDKKTISGV